MNIPRGEFRRLFCADPGKVLIKADLKQAEYMCFCWFAPVHELVERYVNDPEFDVHRLNASLVWGIPEHTVTKSQRSKAKNGVYAGTYKVGALKISRLYNMPFKDAKFILERYQSIRPELAMWWNDVKDRVKATRSLTNPLGRQRIFFGRMDDDTFRAAYSHSCQSTVADIILRALVALDRQGVELLLQVHDEIVCQCPEDLVDETVAKVKAAMEIPITIPGVKYPLCIPTEISVGPNWYDVTPYEEWKRGSVESS